MAVTVISPHFSLQNEANDTKVNVPTEAPTPTAEWYVVRTEASQGHCTVPRNNGPPLADAFNHSYHAAALSAPHLVLCRVCLTSGGHPTGQKVTLKA